MKDNKDNRFGAFPKIISIDDIRKAKGLSPVGCDANESYKEEEKKRVELDTELEKIDDLYDTYIYESKNVKDEKEHIKLFKNFLNDFNLFFDYIYKEVTKKILDASPLKEEINYAMMGSGKRLRPCLMYMAYRAFEGEVGEDLVNFMVAIEMIHSYSLIHDDLPCMDNDELRRGKPSTWKKFGEAKALLAGDAMISMAQEIAGYVLLDSAVSNEYGIEDIEDEAYGGNVTITQEDIEEMHFEAHLSFVYGVCIQILASSAGAQGMAAGQMDEILLQEKEKIEVEDIIGMYSRKTGCLLSACLTIGYEISLFEGYDFFAELENTGRIMGALYQIKDDLDDIMLTTEELGKPAHSDEKNKKSTYVATRGIDGAKKDIEMMQGLLAEKFLLFQKEGIEIQGLKDFVYFFMNK